MGDAATLSPAAAPDDAGGRVATSRRAFVVVVAVLTVVAFGLRLHRLAAVGFLSTSNFDDGVYFGDAVRLVHGVLPYRDFVAVHPPGIMLLMAPVAGLSLAIGSAKAFVIARVLGMLAGAAGVPLLALLLRHRGLVTVIVGCAVLALYPGAIRSSETLLLEPWLVLFCLAGLLAAFRGDTLLTGRRIAVAGVLFGFAGTVKIWAVAPAVVLAALLVRRPRELARFVGCAVAAFVVVVLPFAAFAPQAFVSQVFTSQLVRHGRETRLAVRLWSMLGLDQIPGVVPAGARGVAAGVVMLAVVVLLAAAYGLRWRAERRRPTPLEIYAIAALVVVVAMFLVARQWYYHYAGFVAPFAALVVALPAGPLPATPSPATSSDTSQPADAQPADARRDRRRLLPVAWASLVVVVTALLAANLMRIESGVPPHQPPLAALRRHIPPGACVLTNHATLLLVIDRFTATDPHCPKVVDSYGTALALAGGREGAKARHDPDLLRLWRASVRHAGWVAWTGDFRKNTPIRALAPYVHRHFVRVRLPRRGVQLYRRRGPAARVG